MKSDENTRSPIGWYVATVIERFEVKDEDGSDADRSCLAWENMYLVQAETLEQAFDKVVEHEEQKASDEWIEVKGQVGRWFFEGVADLVPVYGELEDFSEILWTEHKEIPVKDIQKMIFTREEIKDIYAKKPERSDS